MTEQQIGELVTEIQALKQVGAQHAELINTHTKNLEEAAKKMKEMQDTIDRQSIIFGRQIEMAVSGNVKEGKTSRSQR